MVSLLRVVYYLSKENDCFLPLKMQHEWVLGIEMGMLEGFRGLSGGNNKVCTSSGGSICVWTLTVYAMSPLQCIQKHESHKNSLAEVEKEIAS